MSNIYYNPEHFGLEIVDDIDFADAYEYDMVVVWYHQATNKYYWDSESGCSCPTPFETKNMQNISQLTQQNFDELKNAIKNSCRSEYCPEKVQNFLTKVRQHLFSPKNKKPVLNREV